MLQGEYKQLVDKSPKDKFWAIAQVEELSKDDRREHSQGQVGKLGN